MNILIFRRELRIQDNTAFNFLVKNNSSITPIFIYDPRQINKENNRYFSDKSVQFMDESLMSLKKNIEKLSGKLFFYYGITERVIREIIDKYPVNSIVFNLDYTIFSRTRDDNIRKLCRDKNIKINTPKDIELYDFNNNNTKAGTPYKKFKWFYKNTEKMNINSPIDLTKKAKFNINNPKNKFSCKYTLIKNKYKFNKDIFVTGGRENGIKLMKKNIKNLENYSDIRQFPIKNKKNTTSFLSAYNKFGCISIRELASHITKTLGQKGNSIIRQLVWRDFYYNLVYNYPETFSGRQESVIKNFPWKNNKKDFKAWCEGKTGYPFIDAGMRQLNKEGYMNNRVRLCCASFLVRNLHIDWRWGERYFAKQLVDYDPSQNNGNWQWISSSGLESQAYYRYMNPVKDLTKYDPECHYVKKYISELKNESNRNIFNNNFTSDCLYPSYIVDLRNSFTEFKDIVKEINYF